MTYLLGYKIDYGVSLFIEYYGQFVPGDVPIHYADGGVKFLLYPNLQLDVSGGSRLYGDGKYWFVSAGLSFRFPR